MTAQHTLLKLLYFDGWYTRKADAERVGSYVAGDGAVILGIIESPPGRWGVLYVAERQLFQGHVLDGENPLWAEIWAN